MALQRLCSKLAVMRLKNSLVFFTTRELRYINYPCYYFLSLPFRKYTLYEYNVDDWTNILALAQKWEFKEVKDLAIRELEKMDIPILKRIALYQQFKVQVQVLIKYYTDLCCSPEALTYEASRVIGLEAAVLIFRARELIRAQPSDGGRSPMPAGLDQEDVYRTLKSLLEPPASPESSSSKLFILPAVAKFHD
jgi:hypothetical protein